jgi:tRNA A22 N-methylase
MEHVAKVVKEVTLENNRAVYHIRCCDDPKSETRHTYDTLHVGAEFLASEKQRHIAKNADAHAKKVQVEQGPAPVTHAGVGFEKMRKH